jgi:hypothetical protein
VVLKFSRQQKQQQQPKRQQQKQKRKQQQQQRDSSTCNSAAAAVHNDLNNSINCKTLGTSSSRINLKAGYCTAGTRKGLGEAAARGS